MRGTMLLLMLTATAAAARVTPVEPASRPPVIAPSPVTDDYFGMKVTDPYRGLEKLDAPALAWMRTQGASTRAVLDSIAPRAAYLARLTALTGQFGSVKDEQIGAERLFYQERAPGRDQFDLMVLEADGTKRRLIDMKAFIAASGSVPHAIDYYVPSRDGTKVAVGISAAGSEDSQLSVVDAVTGRTLAGPVDRAQFGSPSWLDDGSGLFFTRLQKLVPGQPISDKYNNAAVAFWTFHSEPVTVVGAAQHLGPNTDPVPAPFLAVVPGSDEALLVVQNGVQNEVEGWTAPLAAARAGTARWRKVIARADAVTKVSADRNRIVLLTHAGAPTFKVTAMKWSGTATTATTIVPARPGRINESVAVARDGVYVGGREGLNARPLRVEVDGVVAPIELPYDGSMGDVVADPERDGAYLSLTARVHPPTTYHLYRGKLTDLGLETRPAIDFAKYRAVEITAAAKDGTKVPLTVLTATGPVTARPLLLDAYGAYGISALPSFNPRYLAFVDAGGAFAECNVRGGGELGDAWRLGGKDANKPNTWRDAIACGEALIAAGYTTKDQLAITGTSAGGIMVGRAATERPDLFAAAITRVGDSNALRSETMVSGPANIPEFGTVADPQGFKNLYEMDAYQHVRDGVTYPAWLLTTGLQDPRVAPWEAAKMTARLQAAGGPRPVLLRIEEQAGHGLGTTRTTRDAEEADIAAFVLWRAGVPEWQPAR